MEIYILSNKNILPGLREKRFDHNDSTSLCHSKTLTDCNEEVNSICIQVQCQTIDSLTPLLDDF